MKPHETATTSLILSYTFFIDLESTCSLRSARGCDKPMHIPRCDVFLYCKTSKLNWFEITRSLCHRLFIAKIWVQLQRQSEEEDNMRWSIPTWMLGKWSPWIWWLHSAWCFLIVSWLFHSVPWHGLGTVTILTLPFGCFTSRGDQHCHRGRMGKKSRVWVSVLFSL